MELYVALSFPSLLKEQQSCDLYIFLLLPAMGAHIVLAWSVAYYFLDVASTYCSLEPSLVPSSNFESREDLRRAQATPSQDGESVSSVGFPSGISVNTPLALPPMLTPQLNLYDISAFWQRSASQHPRQPINSTVASCAGEDSTSNPKTNNRCIFSWMASVSAYHWKRNHVRARAKEVLRDDIGSYLKYMTGWQLSYIMEHYKKPGFVPTMSGGKPTPGSELVFEFANATEPLRVVGVFYMKSYGDDWDSKVLLEIQEKSATATGGEQDWTTLTSSELTGLHDRRTSETYALEVDLPHAIPPGGSLRVRYNFVSGKKFKLQGMSVCS